MTIEEKLARVQEAMCDLLMPLMEQPECLVLFVGCTWQTGPDGATSLGVTRKPRSEEALTMLYSYMADLVSGDVGIDRMHYAPVTVKSS